ncbi:hypothetical protein [Rheinheimera tangshanensis]|uniref:Uncharacterized protein n=1 Tax=Rheinheimera tangshanensis TaxID=400153 RepID=A0A5C8M5I2_9GAMM|nr:hypothetical protein [Rheinheimera tangshanensis]TXK83189.1 hypothetical protein FU839_02655 [Rheinheimera tangshanensis]GGM45567.1 hypothetical protein GCM10010920_02360 [Rheinheimera tangshanensis]
MIILIKAIKSQLNLKPYFYDKAAKVGSTGCILGGFLAYILFMKALPVFGIDLKVPLKEYSDQLVFSIFGFGLVLLLVCLYLLCSLCAALYFFPMLKRRELEPEDYKSIVFKSIYPVHWQKM